MSDKKIERLLLVFGGLCLIAGVFLLAVSFAWWGSMRFPWTLMGGIVLVAASFTLIYMRNESRNEMTPEELEEYERKRKKVGDHCGSCGRVKIHPDFSLKKYDITPPDSMFSSLRTLCDMCRTNYQRGGFWVEVIK